ncbi:NUDIX domain-containing protein [Patescibacteria group bacterium]|nr:NUDIX domain-containing protein [Patescibacteria group bacterium]MBU2035903.1 NUDIX domain-containing protein [Patescibacteria group bacterium]
MDKRILIKEISDLDFDPNHKMGDINDYSIRKAARGILINNGKIALLNVIKINYHKLPGGGVEKDESINEAFKREVMEETGCKCEILDQSGIIIEWRDQFKLIQISYVFVGKVIGKIGKSKLEQGEIDKGFKLEWIPFEKIDKVLKKDNSSNHEGKFIQIRDRSIFEFYKDRLKGF